MKGYAETDVPAGLPRILSFGSGASQSTYQLAIDPDLECFVGHFPGRPVLAGIVQVHWAVVFSGTCFGLKRVPVQIKRLKFKNVVVPPAILELSLVRVTEIDVTFTYIGAGGTCSEGRLIFPGMLP
ncbi:MAG: hypothetical protein WD448_13775 [Woeseia sp.]